MALTPRTRQAARWGATVLAAVVLLALVAAVWVRSRLAACAPIRDGTRAVAGLAAAVEIARDRLGVPTIRASSRRDAAFAVGFLHGQERFFQLDLLRRRAAGELAEVFGAGALDADRAVRRHRLRWVADRAVADADAGQRELSEAYAAGVNAGLAALGAPPFEYQVLRVAPAAWRPADSMLAVLAMYLTLQDADGERELALGVMHDTLPPALFAFLAPAGTEWDAPLEGGALATPSIPGSDAVDLRRAPPSPSGARLGPPPSSEAGSNNWALAGRRTASGAALVANDPHLALGVPTTWYRACIEWRDANGPHRVVGVTLPGTPAIVIGSNGRVAWGFTNTEGDWSDVVPLEVDPSDPETYATPDGPRRIEHVSESIRVRDGADVTLDASWSAWGPVLGKDHRGRPYAVRWVANEPGAVSLALLGLESASSVEEAIAAAHRGGIPAQNLVCGSADGHIAWTVAGLLPHRVGCDGRLPTADSDGACRWEGWLTGATVPTIVDPPTGAIWTANARVAAEPASALIGTDGYALGARAGQIRDDLAALAGKAAAERDMLAVQLDDRARFLARWRDLLLALLAPAAVDGHPDRAEFRRLVAESWDGRASIDSVGYRLVREFRVELARRAFAPLVAPCRAADPGFELFAATSQWEAPLWALVSARPVHLLDPSYKRWEDLELAAVDAVSAALTTEGGPLAARGWGERNTARIRHPLSRALPWLGVLLDMPAIPLPGDRDMPRVQSPSFGASMRLVVSPGREETGIFELPGGQSGHPLSPNYRDEFGDWAAGDAVPLLPGPTTHILRLVPASR